MSYTGRFAPSPTGSLHFGSLLAALASYLDAKHQQGRWLVRIENLDPPREIPGAADAILRTLEAFGLHWDDSVIYQIDRRDYYLSLLDQLRSQKLAYPCGCSRSQLKHRNALHHYDQKCWYNPPILNQSCAFRARMLDASLNFEDRILGKQSVPTNDLGDFIIYRRDQLVAYQLAVVADDVAQGITHIVRGADLLQETYAQLQLQQHLGFPRPTYAHIPLAVTGQGQKLSKQNHAPPIEGHSAVALLTQALEVLGQLLPQDPLSLSIESLLHWSTKHWCIENVPKRLTIKVFQ